MEPRDETSAGDRGQTPRAADELSPAGAAEPRANGGDATAAVATVAQAGADDVFARAPLLAVVAALAALADCILNRVVAPALMSLHDRATLVSMLRWSDLPRNLAAIAGGIALLLALFDFLRRTEFAPVWRRLTVAGFAGILMPTVALATFLPSERTTQRLVFIAAIAAYALVVLFGATSARQRMNGVAPRVALALTAVMGICALAALVIGSARAIALTFTGVVTALSRIGEFAYLATPLVAAVIAGPRGSSLRDRIAQVAGALVLALVVVAFGVGQYTLNVDFAPVLYLAQRVEWLLDTLPMAYGVPIAVALAVGVSGLLTTDAVRRQAGAALILLVSAGYAPRAPGRLLSMVLAVALLCRAVLALSKQKRPRAF